MTNQTNPNPADAERRKATCEHKNTKLVDYDPAMHDGRVICADCKAFIRWYDAG